MSCSLIITFVCFLCMYSGSKCEIYKQTWWSYITFSLCRIWHYLVPIFSWTWSPSASKSCHSHYLYVKFLMNGFQLQATTFMDHWALLLIFQRDPIHTSTCINTEIHVYVCTYEYKPIDVYIPVTWSWLHGSLLEVHIPATLFSSSLWLATRILLQYWHAALSRAMSSWFCFILSAPCSF